MITAKNFAEAIERLKEKGFTFIWEDGSPRYLLVDLEKLTDEEKIDIIPKSILEKYLDAFKALAK